MWASLFYGQTYLSESFEGVTFPPTGWADIAGPSDQSNNTYSAGSFITGVTYTINSTGTTDFTLIGAADSNPGTVFTATGPGTGTGDAIGQGNSWASSGVAAHTGTKSAFFNDFLGDNDKWLISESFDLTGAESPELSYYMYTRFPSFFTVNKVYYSIDYNGSNFAGATWIELDNITLGEVAAADEMWKIQGNFDLSAADEETSVYIAFNYNYVGGTPGESGYRLYLDDILVRDQPSCYEPTTTATFSNVTANSADFNFTPNPGGSETLWDVELVDLTAGQTQGTGTITSTSSNPHSFNSLTPGNSYEVYVRADCGVSTSAWVGPFAFSTGYGNDECSGAIVIVQEIEIPTSASASITNGTIDNATRSETTGSINDASGCSGGYENFDVWFAFEARTDAVNITVNGAFDSVIELFSGTCESLTSMDCEDLVLGEENLFITGLTAGTTYYFKVDSYDFAASADGTFTVKVWSSESLSVEDNSDVAEFKLYPNPVQDKLNLRAQDNIENVSIYNMLGQEVLRQTPNKNSSEVNMSALQTGSYFVKVTINGVTETKQIIKR